MIESPPPLTMLLSRHTRRRDFLWVVGCCTLGTISSYGQELTRKIPRIGHVLNAGPNAERFAHALELHLDRLGYSNGKNITLIVRYSRPQELQDTIRSLASDADIIVVWGTIGGIAAKKASVSVPIVFISVGAPVNIGLVESLAHPGGNMTGISFEAANETYGKRLQIIKEIVPQATRVGILRAAGDPNVQFVMMSLEKTAQDLGINLLTFDFQSPDELGGTFEQMHLARKT
jgi:putative tryptophan/tyrosine transport system substrate-binding protein